MKVALDLTSLLPVATGVDTYERQLVTHLGQLDHSSQYTIFVNYEDRFLFKGLLPPNFTIAPCGLRLRPARLLFQQLWLPAAARALAFDVVHSPSFLMPFYRGRQRQLLTVHDMTFFSRPECHTAFHRSRLFRQAILHSIRRADLVSVPSSSTKRDIVEGLPGIRADHIRVIPYGVGEEFLPRDSEAVQAAITRLHLPRRYILFVGTIEPRKNLAHLVESYRQLVRTGAIAEHLVLAGPLGWGYESLLKRLEAPELKGKIHLRGYVPRSDLPWLYAAARLFIYPSLYEGFGFPPLEAMACGVPTIASSSSSLAENLHGAAELVPPADESALQAAIRRLLGDEPLRVQYREKGLARVAQFRWERTARQTLDCYRDLAARQ